MSARAPHTIRTERLHLHVWDPTDAGELRALIDANDAHLRPWIPFMKHEPRTVDGTREVLEGCVAGFEANEHYRYAMRVRADGRLVGEVMLIGRGPDGSMEIGYWIDAHETGKGFVSEGVAALVDLAFGALELDAVQFVCDLANAPSIAVAERTGARRVGVEHLEEEGRSVELGTWRLERAADASH